MSDHDDFAFEAAPGIPAPLPKGEEVLWQGRPATRALARDAFKIHWIGGYLALIVLWKTGLGLAEGGVLMGLARGLPYLALALAGYGIVLALAWAQARSTVYTITSARVLMRIGAALAVTYNIPFAQIGTARLDQKADGTAPLRWKRWARRALPSSPSGRTCARAGSSAPNPRCAASPMPRAPPNCWPRPPKPGCRCPWSPALPPCPAQARLRPNRGVSR
jgi:hypothetical protein